MGTGVDIVYPASHARLAEEILAAGGALVSQFPNLSMRYKLPIRRTRKARQIP